MNGSRPLSARKAELDLRVGAVVVYGGHGLGRITAARPEASTDAGDNDPEEAEKATVVVEFASGLSIILPLERAQACLRPPAGITDVKAIRATLRSQNAPTEQSWQSRTRTTRTKIALGDLVSLAEVIRDAAERERRLVPPSQVSYAEQRLYRKARSLLTAELAIAVAVDETQAEIWIETQLDGRDGE